MADSENFQSCLQTVVDLRSKTANAIKAASDGTHARHGAEMEGKEKKFLSELKLTMDVVNSQIKYEFIFQLNNNIFSLFHLFYLSTSTMECLEISRMQMLEISRFCILEISRHCIVEVDE